MNTLTGSANGRVIVAGLRDGRIMRWDRGSRPKLLARLPRAVAEVRTDAAGTTIVATDSDPDSLDENATAVLLHAGERPQKLTLPAGQSPELVGVSPSGRTVVVAGEPAASGGARTIAVIDGRTGVVEARHDATDEAFPTQLVVPSDKEVVLFNGGSGGWDRRRFITWQTVDRGGVELGAHQAAGEPSADGEYMTATNGAPEIPVWRMRGKPINEQPTLTAGAPIGSPDDLALSPDGTRLAVTDTGVTYVADTVRPGQEHPDPVVLKGNGNVEHVRFLGSGTRLLTMSGNKVALWDLRQPDRLARPITVPVGIACSACTGALIAISPDGMHAAVVSGSADSAALVDLSTGRSARLPATDLNFAYADPLWDQRAALFPVVPSAGGTHAPVDSTAPAGVRIWRAGDGSDPIFATEALRRGLAVIVNARGKIFLQRTTDGTILRTLTPYPDLQPGNESIKYAAADPSGERIAMLLDDQIGIYRLGIFAPSGRIVQRFRDPGAAHLAFGGPHLFVQKDDGTLEVRSAPSGALERTIAGDPSYAWPPVPNPQGTMVARQRRNGDITLVDTKTGSTLATVQPTVNSAVAKIGVAFSPDGQRLITLTDETAYKAGAVLLDRDLSEATLVRSACQAAGAGLTNAQWERFVGSSPPSKPICP